jgi:hypothetical protein
MDRRVVFNDSAPFLDAGQRVMMWVHDYICSREHMMSILEYSKNRCVIEIAIAA